MALAPGSFELLDLQLLPKGVLVTTQYQVTPSHVLPPNQQFGLPPPAAGSPSYNTLKENPTPRKAVIPVFFGLGYAFQ
jgi:hypothetical protein